MMTDDTIKLLVNLHYRDLLGSSEYVLLRKALEGLEADRDRWKARAEALERYAKEDCCCCKHGNSGFPCNELCEWEFDEAKYKECAG